MEFEKGMRTDKNIFYRRLRSVWSNMMDRCYKETHYAHKNYGAKGVYVAEDWRTLDGFLKTVDLVDGWDSGKFLNGDFMLDKDFKDRKNLEYSVEKCSFASLKDNNKIKPNQQKEIIGTSPSGKEFRFYNQSEFARDYNLSQSSISACAKGKRRKHKGWKFKYAQ